MQNPLFYVRGLYLHVVLDKIFVLICLIAFHCFYFIDVIMSLLLICLGYIACLYIN